MCACGCGCVWGYVGEYVGVCGSVLCLWHVCGVVCVSKSQ